MTSCQWIQLHQIRINGRMRSTSYKIWNMFPHMKPLSKAISSTQPTSPNCKSTYLFLTVLSPCAKTWQCLFQDVSRWPLSAHVTLGFHRHQRCKASNLAGTYIIQETPKFLWCFTSRNQTWLCGKFHHSLLICPKKTFTGDFQMPCLITGGDCICKTIQHKDLFEENCAMM